MAIKTIIFDMGGVIITIDNEEPKKRFTEMGVKNASELMNPYLQSGIFRDLEEGKISTEDFRLALSRICGRELTFEEVKHCWLGYMKEIPHRNLEALLKLRQMGYRVILLSNTNGYATDWTDSDNWDGEGHPISYYFDAMYRSYEVKMMKPDENFFHYVLAQEQLLPEEVLFLDDGPRNVAAASQVGIRTYCPQNGADWTRSLFDLLQQEA